MENKQIVEWNMYEMEYTGGRVESSFSLVPFEEKYYEQYVNLMDDCYYEMRKALNIRPYEKHSYSLDKPMELKKNTFILPGDNDEIIGAVTISETYIGTVAVGKKYQQQGYGRKLTQFAISYIQNCGDKTAKLAVAKWNKNAIALYKSLGFVITKESTVEGVNTKSKDGSWSFEFTETKGLDIQ
ncbi:MAG: GNAT family N-acetyltransferase [Defluviitaleaceae bacterium]|nr:GNAT family N-acetyltransferase [Defluviitaleaceae bacterium]